ncbi:hypothetical protein GCM10009839_43480 [Catenulispora yoronensis]|uniref:Uncharacterized protein n=1 Tax=Catenulispora yoronensis TaxID=450799 RepID=A0ABP5G4Y2_9ACTN
MSASVTVYGALVHVIRAPGTKMSAGQVTARFRPARGVIESVTVTPVRVTLPVLTTSKDYEITSPASFTVAGVADFDTVNDGVCLAVTVADDGGLSTASPVGEDPCATAVFAI